MKKKGTTNKVAVGVAAAAVAAGAAAGAYYLYGSKNAKEHRKAVAKWAGAAKREVEREVKSLKSATLNEKNYKAIVKEVSGRYKTLKNLDPKEVAAFVTAVSADWKKLRGAAQKGTSTAKKTVKKAVKKAAKKVKAAAKKR